MNSLDLKKLDLLKKILSQPTAPYREKRVIDFLKEFFAQEQIPYFSDPHGNLVLGVQSKNEYFKRVRLKTQEPLRLFMAHLDHPGFHGVQWLEDGLLKVQWYGGAPTQFLENAPVWVTAPHQDVVRGRMRSAELTEKKNTIHTAQLQFPEKIQPRFSNAKDIYGGFSFREPVWQEGSLLYTHGADDLAGVFSVVSLAQEIYSKKSTLKQAKSNFLGILTRAEEVGFVGAIAHFSLNWLQKPQRKIVLISLETSRTLQGAEIGKGPVVRLGDRFTVFDASGLKVLADVAQKELPESHQKRIMDGGRCEASAGTCFGIPSLGISIPLGNYHNQSFEGGPDSRGPLGPAPEFVHVLDVFGALKLCQGLMKPKLEWAAPWKKNWLELLDLYKKGKKLLASGL